MKKSNIKNFDELPLFINASILAELFGISKVSAYELMRGDDFPSIKIGKRVLVSKEELIKWIKESSQKPRA